MAASALYKRTRMGQLPGDIPRQAKAAILEGKIRTSTKTGKRLFVKKANRRMRRKPIEVD
jgi:hypothetical protein